MDEFLSIITKKEVYGLVITLVFVFLFNKLFNIILDRALTRGKTELAKKKSRTVIELIKNIKTYALVLVGVIFVLDLYGVNVSSLVASLGIASAVGALALQDTLKDFIGGATIIMDNYYIVGDIVKYNNFTGTVIQFGLKTTKIQNVDGEVLVISNRNVSEVVNLSQKQASGLIEIPTAYEEKTEKVEKVINEIVEEIKTWPTIDQDKTSYIGICALGDSSVVYGIRFYSSLSNLWQYKRDILRLVKVTYDKNNIKIPYNQIEVHNGK